MMSESLSQLFFVRSNKALPRSRVGNHHKDRKTERNYISCSASNSKQQKQMKSYQWSRKYNVHPPYCEQAFLRYQECCYTFLGDVSVLRNQWFLILRFSRSTRNLTQILRSRGNETLTWPTNLLIWRLPNREIWSRGLDTSSNPIDPEIDSELVYGFYKRLASKERGLGDPSRPRWLP